MVARLVSATRPRRVGSAAPSGEPLRGPWLVIARSVWLAVAGLALVLFTAAIIARYDQLTNPPVPVLRGLAHLGFSAHAYALYTLALSALFALACFGTGALIAWRKPGDAMALFVSLFLLMLGALYGPNAAALEEAYPGAYFLITFSYAFVIGTQVLMLFLFPDGRFVPQWIRGPVIAWIALLLLFMGLPGEPMAAGPGVFGGMLLISGLGTGVAAQIYRYVRVSTTVQRQKTKWVVFGVAMAALGFILLLVSEAFFPSATRPAGASLLYDMARETGALFAAILIPVTVGIAILRYQLWDIDVVINRALVYGALTISTIGIYALVVGGLGALFQGRDNGLVSLLAAGLIAVLFAPLRDRLQRGANRLLYGDRDDPYKVLSRLGQRIGVALAPDAVLPAVVESVREALKLPYAAITLRGGDPSSTVQVASGEPVGDPLRLPLVYQQERVGELVLGPRAPGEAFSPNDRRLLEDLAHQAGAAIHAVRLNADLQRSRERLVTAREEERRRLRRDLHDGLGPALAAMTLKIGSARALLSGDSAMVDTLLQELEADLEAALTDIRRLVYSLRPPALDELGLVAAIRETAEQYRPRQVGADGSRAGDSLRIVVETPQRLPPLPAAVEVAAYRIAQEALTNVVRHAQARRCLVRVAAADDCLSIEVTDDGMGVPAARRVGVGLTSMRERATELGGTFLIESLAAGGTRLLACLPLPAVTDNHRGTPDIQSTAENSAPAPPTVAGLPPTTDAVWTSSAS